MKPSDVLEVIARLQVAYREEINDAEENLWIEKLADLPDESVWAAVESRIESTERFLPRVGEIVAAVAELGRLTGPEAWEAVLDEIRRIGIYGKPTFADGRVARAVELVGWERLCNSDSFSPWPFKEFERVYEGVIYWQSRRQALARAGAGIRELTDGIGEDPDA